jgi:hypothetical protein
MLNLILVERSNTASLIFNKRSSFNINCDSKIIRMIVASHSTQYVAVARRVPRGTRLINILSGMWSITVWCIICQLNFHCLQFISTGLSIPRLCLGISQWTGAVKVELTIDHFIHCNQKHGPRTVGTRASTHNGWSDRSNDTTVSTVQTISLHTYTWTIYKDGGIKDSIKCYGEVK